MEDSKLNIAIKKLTQKCKGERSEYNCSMLFYLLSTITYFKNSTEPFLRALAWFNYFVNKENISCDDDLINVYRSNKKNSTIGSLNNNLMKCLNDSDKIISFFSWIGEQQKNPNSWIHKEKNIIIPSINILKKELIQIKKIIKPDRINEDTWKFMENYWYIRLLGTTLLPLNDRSVELTGQEISQMNIYNIKKLARVTDEDKIITSLKLYHRPVNSGGFLSGIKSTIGYSGENMIPNYYLMGKLYPNNKPLIKTDGSCDLNASRIMGLIKKGSQNFYQPIKNYSLACADNDKKIKTRSYKYMIKTNNSLKKIQVDNIIFIELNNKNKIKIKYNDKNGNELKLEYNKQNPPVILGQNMKEVGIISILEIEVIKIVERNGLITYDILDNAYVMRDQFSIDILGKDTINMLIHLYSIIQIPNFM